jgi:hypothetical protein
LHWENRNTSQKLPKEVIATVQTFAKKRNSGLHAILRMFFPYYYIHIYICMPSFGNFMLPGFHAMLIVFPHLLQYALVTTWFTFSTKLAFTEGPFSGSAQGQPPSYTGHSMG